MVSMTSACNLIEQLNNRITLLKNQNVRLNLRESEKEPSLKNALITEGNGLEIQSIMS